MIVLFVFCVVEEAEEKDTPLSATCASKYAVESLQYVCEVREILLSTRTFSFFLRKMIDDDDVIGFAIPDISNNNKTAS